MHPSGPGKQFHWPTKVDTCWSSNIVCVIEAPVLSSSSSRKYIISENDYKKITEAYDQFIIIMVLLGTFPIYSLDNLIYIHNPSSGFILLQAYKKLSLFMTILAKKIITFL